ncbi:hypothetical protein COOONC_02260 [Cooperia oncophora]
MYGKEGRRVEYPAFPCSTIILSNPPAAGDCHGCPFKHQDHQLLAQRLEKDGLNREQINQVLSGARSKSNHLIQSHSSQMPAQMVKKEEDFSDSEQ